jgi:hypothetical protein
LKFEHREEDQRHGIAAELPQVFAVSEKWDNVM